MATPASPAPASIVPAQLGFLAIYNPTLGATDDTLDDQIVYYASVNTQSQKRRHRGGRGKPTDNLSQDERNERLRQIGLAQGMVDFSRGFSGGEPLDTIDTEKTRVVLRELEPGWWILASIDLTKLPLPPRLGASAKGSDPSENVEYSSREVKPAMLLLQDLLRAHSTFLLHHTTSLSALFVRSRRSRFVSILGRYWDLFLSTWNVMLHGNPATNIFGGIKIAACGELGVGVGEEERGSGEREVLEGFVGRVEGLVDLVVSKFGSSEIDFDVTPTKDEPPDEPPSTPWLGTGEDPGAEDGAIFLGVGALSRKSLRDVAFWMEDLYTWGEEAYGVRESPRSTRQSRRPKKSQISKQPRDTNGSVPSEPPPDPADHAPKIQPDADVEDEGGVNKFMSYLKMGYGTHWSLGGTAEPLNQDGEGADGATITGSHQTAADRRPPTARTFSDDIGHYLIGLKGEVEEASASDPDNADEVEDEEVSNSRVLLRTLMVEMENASLPEAEVQHDLGSGNNELSTTKSGRKDWSDPAATFDSQDRNKTKKMRVVVYVSKPFIYLFLFENRTDSLAWDGLYRSMHYQLSPLRKLLAASTTYRPGKPDMGSIDSNIFDLIWDPKDLTIHTTIPSIPDPLRLLDDDPDPTWSRVEAINTHNQILNIFITMSTDYSELERTCKTSRGWWIVWTRIPVKPSLVANHSNDSTTSGVTASDISGASKSGQSVPSLQPTESADSALSHVPSLTSHQPPKPKVKNEIFLIRRAGDARGPRSLSTSYSDRSTGSWAGADGGAGRLAQGIGVDTKRYIEGLLSLNR